MRSCPGRFVVPGGRAATEAPETLAPGGQWVTRAGEDDMYVAVFPHGGGLLTYRKASGDFVHTFNTHRSFFIFIFFLKNKDKEEKDAKTMIR